MSQLKIHNWMKEKKKVWFCFCENENSNSHLGPMYLFLHIVCSNKAGLKTHDL